MPNTVKMVATPFAQINAATGNSPIQNYQADANGVFLADPRDVAVLLAAGCQIIPQTGPMPSSMTTSFGAGLATFLEEGNVFRYVSAGINPGATAADNVLAVYSLPANSFDVTGRGVTITASGAFAANGNNKTCKIIAGCTAAVVGSTVSGGTTIGTTGVSAGNNVGWQLCSNLFKYGAPGSNTQLAQEIATVVGATHGGMGLPQLLTLPENAAILIAVTGNAATTATDISLAFAEINAMN